MNSVSFAFSMLGGIAFFAGLIRINRRAAAAGPPLPADGSALPPEEKRAQVRRLWEALQDPAQPLDRWLLIGGFVAGAGFLSVSSWIR